MLTPEQRLRRAETVCHHFLRNLAFYKAGWKISGSGKTPLLHDDFWITTNTNFANAAVLEWWKLFGDTKGKYYWKKIITNKDAFFSGLLLKMRLTKKAFDQYIKDMTTYRHKFVAHLDEEQMMYLPYLNTARHSVSFLYSYLIANEETDINFRNRQSTAVTLYDDFRCKGKNIYLQQLNIS